MNSTIAEMDLPGTTSDYQQELAALTSIVRKHVIPPHNRAPLFNLYDDLLDHPSIKANDARSRLISLFAREAESLLQHAEKGRALVASGSVLAIPEASNRLLERLTGTWLALYFLGCPSIHPWEAVAFFAEGSGFPRGASLSKAIGDVYRAARKAYLGCPQDTRTLEEDRTVCVLDHNPLAMQMMKKRMDEWEKNEQERMPHEGKNAGFSHTAFLGMLYERLQLALYLHAGGPMRFYVPRSSMQLALTKNHTNDGRAKLQENVISMWTELENCFPARFAYKQFVRIVDDKTLEYMPGCILRATEGMYRAREVRGNFSAGPAGNYLPTRVRREFEKKLKGIKPDRAEAWTLESFKSACEAVLEDVPVAKIPVADSPVVQA